MLFTWDNNASIIQVHILSKKLARVTYRGKQRTFYVLAVRTVLATTTTYFFEVGIIFSSQSATRGKVAT